MLLHRHELGAGQELVRVVVGKPFGKDLQSSEDLAEHLGELYPEEQLYRMSHHYLGKVRTCPKAVCSRATQGAWT